MGRRREETRRREGEKQGKREEGREGGKGGREREQKVPDCVRPIDSLQVAFMSEHDSQNTHMYLFIDEDVIELQVNNTVLLKEFWISGPEHHLE